MGYNSDKVIRFRYLFYEFLGTLLCCVSYNLAFKEYHWMFLICLVFSWNHSTGHFNTALTFGELFLRAEDVKDFCKGIVSMFLIILAQALGAVAGYFLSWLALHVEYRGLKKINNPTVPTLCPNAGGLLNSTNGCDHQFHQFSVFFSEFIACLIAYGTFYLLKHIELPKDEK